MFKPVNNQVKFPEIEENIQKLWEEQQTFKKSLDQRKNREEFVFYDGPPFATGLPHYGHLLAGTIKDVIPRYQTMKGKYVDRVFGWDCHGLPIEYEMEQELKLSGKSEIEEYGIDKFNEACRGIVLRYTSKWEDVVKRMGRWVDFENGYQTMDRNYMESIWWVFKQLWDKDLIYEGNKILPYCPRCATPLSNFEANQGYEEVEDPSITLKFQSLEDENLYFLAWTTTPWTLPSNLALAAGKDINYVKVKDGDIFYILAEVRLDVYYKDEKPEIIERFTGEKLLDRKYKPLFPYFANFAEKGAFRIVNADFVSTEDGTGLVHMAPGFGEDDAITAKQYGVPEVCPIDAECRFTEEVPDYKGVYVKDADKDIIKRLKTEGKLVHRSTIKHNYPHCWRDDEPLIYRAVSTWFVKIDSIKEKMLNSNSQICWVPDHIKNGRFGKWLENARDWAISRNRYWGCPLPIWRNEDGETVCVGSVSELEKLTGQEIPDIHKHFVDEILVPSDSGGKSLQRIPQVLDCWFESGSMPYAQWHYPFDNKARFENNFPADFIAEGLDQTRGWFYTLIVLSSALFDKPSFKNVIVNGLILAEDGQKMSKRKKNYPDPQYILDSYGADALRLFMLGSQVVRGEDLKFSEDGIKEILRSVIIPMWNSYSFFITYANVDKWQPTSDGTPPPVALKNPLDRWILSSLAQMIEEITENMDNYQLQRAANRFEKFVEDLTNWYIRRSRRRFWKSQNDSDKQEAYQTLYYVLLTFTKTAAPFIPFTTEEIYQNLKTDSMSESVHLCDFPVPEQERRDVYLEKQMEYSMTAVSLGRYLRTQHNLKLRQPLSKVIIVSGDEEIRKMLSETSDIISEELNVKNIVFSTDEDELVIRKAKPDFKKLGPKLGKEMKNAAGAIAKLPPAQIAQLLKGEKITISLTSGTEIEIGQDDIIIQRDEKEGVCVATEAGVTIALDTVLNEDLKAEGFAREFVHCVQNLRKESAMDVTDRIKLIFSTDEKHSEIIMKFNDYICNETLTSKLEQGFEENGVEITINGVNCKVNILKQNP